VGATLNTDAGTKTDGGRTSVTSGCGRGGWGNQGAYEEKRRQSRCRGEENRKQFPSERTRCDDKYVSIPRQWTHVRAVAGGQRGCVARERRWCLFVYVIRSGHTQHVVLTESSPPARNSKEHPPGPNQNGATGGKLDSQMDSAGEA